MEAEVLREEKGNRGRESRSAQAFSVFFWRGRPPQAFFSSDQQTYSFESLVEYLYCIIYIHILCFRKIYKLVKKLQNIKY